MMKHRIPHYGPLASETVSIRLSMFVSFLVLFAYLVKYQRDNLRSCYVGITVSPIYGPFAIISTVFTKNTTHFRRAKYGMV